MVWTIHPEASRITSRQVWAESMEARANGRRAGRKSIFMVAETGDGGGSFDPRISRPTPALVPPCCVGIRLRIAWTHPERPATFVRSDHPMLPTFLQTADWHCAEPIARIAGESNLTRLRQSRNDRPRRDSRLVLPGRSRVEQGTPAVTDLTLILPPRSGFSPGCGGGGMELRAT